MVKEPLIVHTRFLLWGRSICSVKLASTIRRTRRCLGVDVGLSDPACGRCELVDDFGGKVAVGIRGLVDGAAVWPAKSEVFL